ncbi:hypothetical protein EGK14_10940 [Erwinia sp. 198]|nr:hypothetical protein EGK14_10940 [Erwinia sp. 198]
MVITLQRVEEGSLTPDAFLAVWLAQEHLDFIRGKSPLCQPGEAFHYANSNFTLPGLLIKKSPPTRLQSIVPKNYRLAKPMPAPSGNAIPQGETRYSLKNYRYNP